MTTAAELIKRSYYLAQVLDPREEIEGFQASEGLFELNQIIDLWGSLRQYIPSYTILTLNILPNVFTYDVTPVITQLSMGHIVDMNNVQDELVPIDLQRFNTLDYSLSITSPNRPRLIFPQNDFVNYPTLTKLKLFPVPDSTYTATLYTMQRLVNVTYSQELSSVPNYWIAAIRYELANTLINIYSTVPAANFYNDYEKVMRNLKAANIRDKTVKVGNEFRQFRRFRPGYSYVG